MLKGSNKRCLQNTIKVLLCFDLFLYICNSNTVITKMVYLCYGNCSKVYSSILSRNKYEKKEGHWPENNADPDISFNEETKLFHCPNAGCATTAKYKYNIVKHLNLCYFVNKNRGKVAKKSLRKGICQKVKDR